MHYVSSLLSALNRWKTVSKSKLFFSLFDHLPWSPSNSLLRRFPHFTCCPQFPFTCRLLLYSFPSQILTGRIDRLYILDRLSTFTLVFSELGFLFLFVSLIFSFIFPMLSFSLHQPFRLFSPSYCIAETRRTWSSWRGPPNAGRLASCSL